MRRRYVSSIFNILLLFRISQSLYNRLGFCVSLLSESGSQTESFQRLYFFDQSFLTSDIKVLRTLLTVKFLYIEIKFAKKCSKNFKIVGTECLRKINS